MQRAAIQKLAFRRRRGPADRRRQHRLGAGLLRKPERAPAYTSTRSLRRRPASIAECIGAHTMVRLRRRAQSLPEPTTTMLGDAATILIRPVTNILASLAGGAAKLGATRLHSTLIKPCGPDSAVAAGYPRHPHVCPSGRIAAIATSLRGPLFPAEPVEHAANAPASSNAFFCFASRLS
jgi:hypothetical protein